MKQLTSLVANLGEYVTSLSNETKKWLVLAALFGLAGGSVYKLVRSIRRLHDPLPVATPQQFIEPMAQLVRQTNGQATAYRQHRDQQLKRADSLRRMYNGKKSVTSHANSPIPKSY